MGGAIESDLNHHPRGDLNTFASSCFEFHYDGLLVVY